MMAARAKSVRSSNSKETKTSVPQLGKSASQASDIDVPKQDAREKYDVWPVWSDADIATEKWDFCGSGKGSKDKNKSPGSSTIMSTSLYEDPESEVPVLPVGFEGTAVVWKRPSEYLQDKGTPVMVSPEHADTCDLVSSNRHLLGDPILSALASDLQMLFRITQCTKISVPELSGKGTATPAGRGAKQQQPPPVDHPRLGVDQWRPWDHIYPRAKGSSVAPHNPSGKYGVRLFWLGQWRKVIVDDRMPFNEADQMLLPTTPNCTELWAPILSKAILKIACLEYARFKERIPDPYHYSVFSMLTGWMPSFPRSMIEWCTKERKDELWELLNKHIPMSALGPCRLPEEGELVSTTPSTASSTTSHVTDSAASASGSVSGSSQSRTMSEEDECGDETSRISSYLSMLMQDPNNIITATLPVQSKEKRMTSAIRREESAEKVEEILAELGLPSGVGQTALVLALSKKPLAVPERPDPQIFKQHFSYLGFMSDEQCNEMADDAYRWALQKSCESILVCFPIVKQPEEGEEGGTSRPGALQAPGVSDALLAASRSAMSSSTKSAATLGVESAMSRRQSVVVQPSNPAPAVVAPPAAPGEPILDYKSIWITAKMFRRLFIWFRVYHRPTSYAKRQSVCDFQHLNIAGPPPTAPTPSRRESKLDKASVVSTASTSQAASGQAPTIDVDRDMPKHYIYIDAAEAVTLCVSLSVYLPWQSVTGHRSLPIPTLWEEYLAMKEEESGEVMPSPLPLATSESIVTSEVAVSCAKRDIKRQTAVQCASRLRVGYYDWFSSEYTQHKVVLDFTSDSVNAQACQLPPGRHILEIHRWPLGIATQTDVWVERGSFMILPETGLWKLLSQPSLQLLQQSTSLAKAVASSLTELSNVERMKAAFGDFGSSLATTGQQRLICNALYGAICKQLKVTLKEKCTDSIQSAFRAVWFMSKASLLAGMRRAATTAGAVNPDQLFYPERAVAGETSDDDDDEFEFGSEEEYGDDDTEAGEYEDDYEATPTECESPDNFQPRESHQSYSTEEEAASTMISTNIHGFAVRKHVEWLKFRSKKQQEAAEHLRLALPDLEADIEDFGVGCWREVMYAFPQTMDCLPFGKDERCHGVLSEYSGELTEVPRQTWMPVFRETFTIDRPQYIAFAMECALPFCRWKMIVVNNDRPKMRRRIFGQLSTPQARWFTENKAGYTFIAYGRSLLEPVPASQFRFLVLASSAPPPQPVPATGPLSDKASVASAATRPLSDKASVASAATTTPLTLSTALSVRTIREYYYPMTKELQLFKIVLLPSQSQRVTISLLLSNRAAVVRLRLLDGDDVLCDVRGGKGEAIVDLSFLNGVPAIIDKDGSGPLPHPTAGEVLQEEQEDGAGASIVASGGKAASDKEQNPNKAQVHSGKLQGALAKTGAAAAKKDQAGGKRRPSIPGKGSMAGAAVKKGNVGEAAPKKKGAGATKADDSEMKVGKGGAKGDKKGKKTARGSDPAVGGHSDPEMASEPVRRSDLMNRHSLPPGQTSCLTGEQRENPGMDEYHILLRNEIVRIIRELEKPSERPKTHRYTLEAHILGNTWPLEESAWHAKFGLEKPNVNRKSLGIVHDVNPERKGRPQSSAISEERKPSGKKKAAPLNKKELSRTKSLAVVGGSSPDTKEQSDGIDQTKPHWTLSIVYNSVDKDGIDVKHDTFAEDRTEEFKARMEAINPGFLKKGKVARDEWLKKMCPTDLPSGTADGGRHGDPLWGAPGHEQAPLRLEDYDYLQLPLGPHQKEKVELWTPDKETRDRALLFHALANLRTSIKVNGKNIEQGAAAKEFRKVKQKNTLETLLTAFLGVLDGYEEKRDAYFVKRGDYSLVEAKPTDEEAAEEAGADKKGKGKEAKGKGGKDDKKRGASQQSNRGAKNK